jgi:hypothetical protein
MEQPNKIEFVLAEYGTAEMQSYRDVKQSALSLAKQSKGRIISGEEINSMMSIQHISGTAQYKIIDTKIDESIEQGKVIAIAERVEDKNE